MARRSNTTVFVVLESSDGSIGIGEALPRRYVTGEEPLDIVNTLRAPLERLVGCSVEEAWELLPTLCIPLLSVRGGLGARCAMELACLDLLSTSSKIPVANVLKLAAPCADTPSVTATLPLLPRWLMKLAIRSFLFAGAKDFKVKLLGDRARDTEILDCATQTTNRDSDIRVDLNMALSFAESVPYLEWLASRYGRLTWIEEPLSAADRHRMPQLQRHFADRFTFCGDEAVCHEGDLTRAIESGAYRAVNIRIGKHGGPCTTAQMIRTAQHAGLAVQIGSLVGETATLSNAGAILARHTGNLRYLEIGLSPMLVRTAPTSGALTPRWGMNLDFAKLPQYGLTRLHRAWWQRTGMIEELSCVS